MSTKYFAELLGEYIFEKGMDALLDFGRSHYHPDWPELDDTDKEVLKHFQASVPTTYQQVGVFFEVFRFQEKDKGVTTVIIPRSFGGTPTIALINESVFNDKDLPDLPDEVREKWVEERAKMTEFAERDGGVERSAFWWEYDRTTREWSVRFADYKLAEDQAKRAIANGVSLAELSRAAPTINGLRANAAQWLNLRELMETRIRDAAVRSRIQELADANETMVLEIDKALEDLRRAQEYQGFLSTLNLIGTLLNVGAQLSSDGYDATQDRMIALENNSITIIERAGNEMKRIDLELKNLVRGYVRDEDIMPSFDLRTIHNITGGM